MRINNFNLNKDILIIAEIGNNHEGSYALAEEMIGLAAAAGAGAVKFQTFKTEYYVSQKDKDRFNRLKSFELSHAEFEKLSWVAKQEGLLFIATPFDLDSAEYLNSIVDAYKISSGDNNFYPLIEKVAKKEKPIIMSTGLADIDQIKKSQLFIYKIRQENALKQDLAVLHCVSSYPVLPEHANLKAIKTLRNELDCTIGYSDHTTGIDASLIAVALGARIIEKHFTIDKNYSDFRDHQLSADPEEFRQLVNKVKTASMMMGTGNKILQEPEISIEDQIRRSIVAKHDLQKGAKISRDDITWIRPAGGLPPGEENKILGKTLIEPVEMGSLILEHNFQEKI